MPLERPQQPLILVTETEDEWSGSPSRIMTPNSAPTTPPRSKPRTTQSSSSSPSRQKIRVRSPLNRAPPSSLALKNMSKSPSPQHTLKEQDNTHSFQAHDHHYTDVFGTRLDSPFQETINELEDVWIDGGVGRFGFDDEVDLDGFKLAMSPDPFKTGSRDEIRASMEMDLPPTPRLESPFHTPRQKKSSKLAQSTTPESTAHSSPQLTPLTRPSFPFSPSSSSCSSTTSPLSCSFPGTPQSRPTGYFPSPMIQSPSSISPPTKLGPSWSPLNSLRRKRQPEGLIGLGIRAKGEKAGLARLEIGSLNVNGQDTKQGEYNDDTTPTGARPSMRLSPGMISRSRSTTPTAKATFTQASSNNHHDQSISTSGGSSDESTTTEASISISTDTTRTSRRAMATASLKRMFRNTFQSPRSERGFAVSSKTKQEDFGVQLKEESKLMAAFLPPVPKIDVALLNEGESREIESWQKRSSTSPNDHRRVSTVGASRGGRMRRSKTEMGIWFTEPSPPRHNSVKFPTTSDSRRPTLMRTDDSVLYPGSPASLAIAKEQHIDRVRSASPSPCARRRSASSPKMLHIATDRSTDGDDSSEASDTDDDEFSEESFTSDPMLSPRDIDVDFSFGPKADNHFSPTGTVSSDGTSTWQYSRYSTKGSNGWSGSDKTVVNKDRRSIQHVLDHTGFLSGTMMRDLTVDLDGRRETQRSQALAKLEGRAGSPKTPEWTNIFEGVEGVASDEA